MSKPRCFIMMPVSTPEPLHARYNGDKDHFLNILEHMIVPAVEMAGFQPLLPTIEGSLVIHAEIIKRLCVAEMSLSDMSSGNSNVFFELGIRTAINKPVALICDDKTESIPFDTSLIKYHIYGSSAPAWDINRQIENLAKHLKTTYELSENSNAMWDSFGDTNSLNAQEQNSRIDSALSEIKREISAIRTIHSDSYTNMKPSNRARKTAIDVFSIISKMSADLGYWVDIGNSSLYKIEIIENKRSPLPKKAKELIEKTGKSYGYNIVFGRR